MSNEVFDFIDRQKRETGMAYWACRACTAYAQGMNHRMKQIEEMKELKQNTSSNTEAIKQLEKKVEEVVEQNKSSDIMSREEFEAMMREEREETREERKRSECHNTWHGGMQ
jgi:hypothetical protein